MLSIHKRRARAVVVVVVVCNEGKMFSRCLFSFQNCLQPNSLAGILRFVSSQSANETSLRCLFPNHIDHYKGIHFDLSSAKVDQDRVSVARFGQLLKQEIDYSQEAKDSALKAIWFRVSRDNWSYVEPMIKVGICFDGCDQMTLTGFVFFSLTLICIIPNTIASTWSSPCPLDRIFPSTPLPMLVSVMLLCIFSKFVTKTLFTFDN